jgi:hypothetical protein
MYLDDSLTEDELTEALAEQRELRRLTALQAGPRQDLIAGIWQVQVAWHNWRAYLARYRRRS